MRHTPFAVLVVVSTISVARAQLPPPAPGAPADPNLSQINGQLVPVGTHNEYYYSFKRWNLSTNPLGWIFGLYGVSASYGFHPNLALRADLNVYQPYEGDSEGYEIGAGLPIYFRRTYSGAFIEPGVMLRQMRSPDGDGGASTSTEMGPQVLIGWHWIWDSGLNVAMAFGAGRNWATEDGDDYHDGDDEELFVNGYLRFGYAF
jgi:hypothetical protein